MSPASATRRAILRGSGGGADAPVVGHRLDGVALIVDDLGEPRDADVDQHHDLLCGQHHAGDLRLE